MKKYALVLGLLVALALSSSALAGGFDCKEPAFGKSLSEINDNDYFVKFMDKDGVAYYNYTGPCRLPTHERQAPLIVYGFVDGKLFCRIIKTWHDDLETIKKVAGMLYGEPKVNKEGIYTVLSWDVAQTNLAVKVKFNNKTREAKSAVYFEPLRKLIKKSKAPLENALD